MGKPRNGYKGQFAVLSRGFAIGGHSHGDPDVVADETRFTERLSCGYRIFDAGWKAL